MQMTVRTVMRRMSAAFVLLGLLSSLTSSLMAQDSTEVENAKPREFDLFSAEFDPLFPPAMLPWSQKDEQLQRGLAEGETLRKWLLSLDAAGVPYTQRICETIAEFQKGSETSLAARKPIVDFSLTSTRLKAQLEGKENISADSFAAFDGRWFGRWGDGDVNHDWRPSKVFIEPVRDQSKTLRMHALQYAWIGNGFGWNYLVTPELATPGQGEFPYVLGMVYYFDGQDFETIRGEKAHVGFVDSPTRLVWITEYEVFLEEVFPAADPQETVYAITALYHHLLTEKPTTSEKATQAVYTRSPKNRPAFFEYRWR
jgi:hypothetical protein